MMMLAVMSACQHRTKRPDVTGIDVRPVSISRYEQALFRLELGDLPPGLDALSGEFRFFLGNNYRDTLNLIRLQNFLQDPVILDAHRQVEKTYPDLLSLEAELTQAFRYWKYYFPGAKEPKVYSYISGFFYEAPVEYYDSVMLISLDMFLGAGYEPYKAIGLPQYMIRRMEPAFIVPDAMKQVAYSLLPAATSDRTLLDQMILHGKVLCFLDDILPGTPDTLKIGYTPSEMAWARDNGKMFWSLLIENDLLYATDPVTVNKFIQDGPFTSGLPEESPAMLGRWMGWQIVRAYLQRNPGVSLQQLFAMTDSQEILSSSRYKPSK